MIYDIYRCFETYVSFICFNIIIFLTSFVFYFAYIHIQLTAYDQPPLFLAINLQRDGGLSKNNKKEKHVLDWCNGVESNNQNVPIFEIDISKFSDDSDKNDNYLYELIGIIDHSGTANKGHYTAYVKNENGEKNEKNSIWRLFNDKNVSEVKNLRDMFTANNSMLFFSVKKIDKDY